MNTILKMEIPMQDYFSVEAKDLLTKLLVKDVSKFYVIRGLARKENWLRGAWS